MSNRLKLSPGLYWNQLEELEDTIKFPRQLTLLMRALISATLNSTVLPQASDELIALAKEYLTEGISLGADMYALRVHVPEDAEVHRSFFTLVREWPNGQLKRLSEV